MLRMSVLEAGWSSREGVELYSFVAFDAIVWNFLLCLLIVVDMSLDFPPLPLRFAQQWRSRHLLLLRFLCTVELSLLFDATADAFVRFICSQLTCRTLTLSLGCSGRGAFNFCLMAGT